MTNGVPSGTNGPSKDDLLKGGGLVVLGAALVCAINTVTTLVEATDAQRWEPWVWEVSSLIGLIVAVWIPWLAAVKAHPDELLAARWSTRLHFVVVHVAGVVAYSLLHVAVFVGVREVAYSAMDEIYRFGGFLPEFRKDLLSYLLFLSVFWTVTMVRQNRKEEVRPVSFDIRDGARIIRVPLADILAVSAAGNYVEFILADGRKPLMRATLGAVEARLVPVGFVRTHRSWIVNPDRLTAMEPAGSGDWTVYIDSVEVPLSRRYSDKLAVLQA